MSRMFQLRGLAVLSITASLSLMGCPSRDVVVVDEHEEVEVTELTEDSINLNVDGFGRQPFEVGDILAGSDQGGYLRRVVTIDSDHGAVNAQTEQVSLNEAVELGTLDGQVQWTSRHFADAGARLVRAGGTAIDFSGTEIFHENGLRVLITEGTLDFAPKMELKAGWSEHRLQHFLKCTGGDLFVDFDIRVETTGPVTMQEEWILWEVQTPFAFSVGPIPVTGSARLAFPLGIHAAVEGATLVETGFDASSHVQFGREFKRGDGWTDLTQLGPFEFNGHEPVWQVEAGLGVEVYMKVQGGLSLYNVSDLTAAGIPYLAADAWLYPAPQTLVLSAGVDAEIAYDMEIFDFSLVDQDWYFDGPNWVLYQGTWN